MTLPGDEILRTYIDDGGNEVTVVKGYDGKTYHCWEMPVSKEVEQMVRDGAKKEGIEEWEYVNMALEAMLAKHAEEDERRKFIEEIILNKNQNWIVFFVALILLINGVFIKALADDDDHEEKKWYKIFDRDDDDDHHNSSKKHKKKIYYPGK